MTNLILLNFSLKTHIEGLHPEITPPRCFSQRTCQYQHFHVHYERYILHNRYSGLDPDS